jgi:hypothetical protein
MFKGSVFQTIQQWLTASWPFIPGRHPQRRAHYVTSAFIFGATVVASTLGAPAQVVRAADTEARLQVFGPSTGCPGTGAC